MLKVGQLVWSSGGLVIKATYFSCAVKSTSVLTSFDSESFQASGRAMTCRLRFVRVPLLRDAVVNKVIAKKWPIWKNEDELELYIIFYFFIFIMLLTLVLVVTDQVVFKMLLFSSSFSLLEHHIKCACLPFHIRRLKALSCWHHGHGSCWFKRTVVIGGGFIVYIIVRKLFSGIPHLCYFRAEFLSTLFSVVILYVFNSTHG